MSPEKAALRLARQILGLGKADAVTVVIATGRAVVVTAEPPPPANGAAPLDAPPWTSPLQRAILAYLSAVPQTPERLAATLGRRCNKYFRGQLWALVDHEPPLARHKSLGFCKS